MKKNSMKTLLLNLALLFILPAVSKAQQAKDNAIIIPAAGINEDKIMMALISSGFPVDRSTPKYYLTAPLQRNLTSIKIAIYLNGDSYVLHGWYDENMSSTTTKQDYKMISYGAGRLSITRRPWNELINVASKISSSYTFRELQ
jgi:hypothetical protein